MESKVYSEVFQLAGNIQDKYLRAVTYAKVGYYLYRAKNPLYKKAFSYALNATSSIESPPLMAKALMEVAGYLFKVNPDAGKKVFLEVHDLISSFPEPLRTEMLTLFVEKLVKLGLLDDALFYALEIEDNVKRNDVLIGILREYLKEGNMRKAQTIVREIQNEPWHSLAAVEVIKEHLKREEFGSALKLLSEINSDYWLGEAMKQVAFYMKNAEVPSTTYEKFVNIALGLSGEESNDVLRSLLVALALQGETNFVKGILDTLEPELRRSFILDVVDAIAYREESLKAFLEGLSGEDFEIAAHRAMDRLLERAPLKEFLPIVVEIGSRTSEDAVLVKVVRYLSKLGDFKHAEEFASRVRGNYLRSLAFGSLAVEKLREGDIDKAIDYALMVKDPKWGSWLLSEILTRILEFMTEGTVGEDIEESAKAHRGLLEGH